MAAKTQIPEFAICDSCGAQTKWNGVSRYVCRAKNAKGSAIHSYEGYSFAGESGICNGSIASAGSWHSIPCDKPGKTEPELADAYNYTTGEIEQIPNKGRYGGSDVAGRTFCGIHSPAKLAARRARKTKTEHEAHEARRDREERAKMETTNDVLTVLSALADSPEGTLAFKKLINDLYYGSVKIYSIAEFIRE